MHGHELDHSGVVKNKLMNVIKEHLQTAQIALGENAEMSQDPHRS